MNILSLIVVALIVEAVWETSKMIWQNGKLSIDRIGAIVVSEVFVYGIQVDMFTMIGLPFHMHFVGMALTGLLISRGANFVHDLLVKIATTKQIQDVSPKQEQK